MRLTCALLLASASALAPVQTKRLKPAAAALAPALLPAAAFAADSYEYGAVDAPGWILPAGAVLAIATALLPLALQSGEEGLEEMRGNEGNSFGSGKDMLGSKRRGDI
mmetsp:Transcript_4586/g.13517  ORF Transcript_4586/g.13517 Transcript_4586/m.13517 type:complete len:108 (+) Transcript_4586:79-402(+)